MSYGTGVPRAQLAAMVVGGGGGERLGGVSKPDLVLGGVRLIDRVCAALGEVAGAQGVARVGAVGCADAFAAVDHAEDAARFKEDRVCCARRGDDVDAGRAVCSGIGEDRGADLGFGIRFLRVAGGRERGRGEACRDES